MKTLVPAIAVVAFAAAANPALSQNCAVANCGVIDGIVSDTSLSPITSAQVSVLGTRVTVTTGVDGRFRIRDVSPGHYLLIVRRLGYRPASAVLEVGTDTLRPSYVLEGAPPIIEGMQILEFTVSMRELEFLGRKRLGFGDFLTRQDIERRQPVYLSDLLRPLLSLNVVATKNGGHMAVSRRSTGLLGQACAMRVVLDEVPLRSPVDLDALIPPSMLAGVEVYRGSATLPPKFNYADGGCGVIVLWTKNDS